MRTHLTKCFSSLALVALMMSFVPACGSSQKVVTKTVEVPVRCMQEPPELPSVDWPDMLGGGYFLKVPDTEELSSIPFGSYLVYPEIATQLAIYLATLHGYLELQLEKCTADAPKTEKMLNSRMH